MTCQRTDAHTIAECSDYADPDVVAQRAFRALVDDRLAFGEWNDTLWADWLAAEAVVPETELRALYGDR